ncbi:MAG: serine hydrolase [Chlorobiaceae bacterium]
MPDQPLTSVTVRYWKQAVVSCRNLLSVRLCIAISLVASLPSLCPLHAESRQDAAPLKIPIESYIVKDISGSKVLMMKDIDRPVSPASLTKVLTCIMAIESGKLDQDVVITKESTEVEPSKAGLRVGDRVKLGDLVKAAMVNSSNDAAFAIAIYLGGNVNSFVTSMNARAKALGMKNSRFTNPAGFDKGIYLGNTSTAGDLLCLTEHAIRNPVFNEIARLERAVFTEQTHHKVFSLKTHNKLLDKYPYAVGIKTGYTCKAGRCLIGRAIKDNRDVLLVMLNAKTDRWGVAADMFDSALQVNSADRAGIVVAHGAKGVRMRLAEGKSASGVRVAGRSLKGGRSAGKHGRAVAIASLKHGRRADRNAVVLAKSTHKQDRKALALSKSMRKTKKRDLALSKPLRKQRRKADLS